MTNGSRACHYETLGVPADASLDEVKAAFRKLSLQTHPDVAGNSACPERFKRIAHAASVLTNATNRQVYDQQRADRFAGGYSSLRPGTQQQPHNRQRPHGVTAILVNVLRPRNLIVGPIVFCATVSAVQYALGIDSSKQRAEDGTNLVEAWKNPETGDYETPAPWDPVYRKLQPELVAVPRDQVRSRKI